MSNLRERIDAATTNEHKWNGWPDKLELVRVTEVDLSDPKEAFRYGGLCARPHEFRQVRFFEFPAEVQPLLKATGWNDSEQSLVYVHFTLAGARGQEDDSTRRNILAVTEPRTNYGARGADGKYSYHDGVLIEIGCNHDYSDAGSNHQRGYHKGLCKRCGHKFMRDSSD
jgi:hypothetical protein